MQLSTATALAPATPGTITRQRAQEPAATAPATAAAPPDLPPLRILQGHELPQATADFAADLTRRFRDAGIRVPPDPVLGSDLAGQVRVANSHPDQARIEAMFENDFDLRNRFAELSGAYQLQRAVENYDEFTAAYQKLEGKPDAQAALVRSRIVHNQAQFFMNIGSDGAEPFFGGLGRITA
ncbi:hypothetical protein [Thauera linaloolentis]|uniref:Uncharacterized protein n=1 Tax=Thauera linaloolentis (strain DSM 12138 / JCM 21573 / CCUG 41526 / CIP 105981 / IAM 15112 / NBRC 102519 / 47Lol) TaxID=1123367 RepID=N6XUF3_THAL4|nr:hypothetical protein [Thauera linaloolentis]ENO85356.1 hypothetical protein C666_15520 [Thauera linaloolentis 47Lol = DSM 12138]MCM8567666.1 hypothetical protein [Thauera linaloolentis]